MTRLSKFIAVFAAAALLTGAAFAQSGCGGQFGANKVCGNATGSTGLPGPVSITPGMFGAIAGGTVVGNPTTSNAVPIATTAPVLGIPGTSTGQVGLAGSGSGTSILRAQTAAGSAVSLLPTAAGTLVGTAVAPLAINATTGEASITGLAGAILYGTPPAFSRTPVLGVPGSAIGTLGFGGNAGGTATITPQATAGSPTLTLPNTSGTFAVGASLPLVLSATTGNLTCPTCATSTLNGAALTKVDDTNVTLTLGGSPTTALLNATSITAGWAGQLGLTRGGTGASLTASNGGLVYSTGAALAILSGTATANQIPLSGSSAAPAWSTATYPATAAAGTVLGASSANVIAATATPVLGANGGTGGQITFNGSTSGSSVVRVPAAAGTGTVFQLPPDNGTNTYVLQTNGSGVTTWVPSAGGGTVTSVGYAAGTGLALSGTASPITSTGSFTYSLASIAADNLLMNSTGSSAAPIATAVNSCSASTSALTYNTSTHAFGCNSIPLGTVTSVGVTAGTGITQSGSPVTTSGNITVNVDVATASNIWSSTSNKIIDAAGAGTGLGLTALTDSVSGTVGIDMATGVNFSLTMTAGSNTRALGNPSNTVVGRCGVIWLVQNASGPNLVTYASNWKFPGGTVPAASTSASAVDMISYCVRSSTFIAASMNKAFQ